MLLNQLKEKALESAIKDKLSLKEFLLDKTFTFCIISDGKNDFIGLTLTPKDEGELNSIQLNTIEDILSTHNYNLALRAVSLALINAIGQYELSKKNIPLKPNLRIELHETIYNLSCEDDNIVFIGNLKPVVKKLSVSRKNISVFCRSMTDEKNGVYNDIFEYEAVEKADVVIITGAALIGSTIDALLKFTSKAKAVILSGFSAGLNPSWLEGFPITHVASTSLKESKKENILNISLEEIFNNSCYTIKR